MAKRRRIEVFSLSFLDAMTCGLGAVILLYLVINAAAGRRIDRATEDRRAEVDRLEEAVLEETGRLAELRNTLERILREIRETRGLSTTLLERLEEIRRELATYEDSTLARTEHIAKLQADLRSLEEETRRLAAAQPTEEIPGRRVRAFTGEGDRQYLTGLRVTGDRVLILVDASASMLGSTLVDVLRRRNLPEDQRRLADKWRQAVATADWLTTQLPRDGRFQIYVFDDGARPVLADTEGRWLDAGDREVLDEAVARLRRIAPRGGTSLWHAFEVVRRLEPPPDNVILLADGLPTRGALEPRKAFVTAKAREKLFQEARERLAAGIPVNVILFPMEGDPDAASRYWRLAMATRGSFLTPTRDWP